MNHGELCAQTTVVERLFACALSCVLLPTSSLASGNFPLASCSGWNGTVVAISGLNTTQATMKGSVTAEDIREYCERDPGSETIQNGGKLTVDQCVALYWRRVKDIELMAAANCLTGQFKLTYGSNAPRKVSFPVSAETDQSCASGLPPLREQFKMLCPKAASTHIVSVKLVGKHLGGKIRKVNVSYTIDLIHSTVSGVVVNCNPSYPQVEIDGKNHEVDLLKNEDRSLNERPLKSIWLSTCR